ncbi:MAG: cytochrome b6-f complex iron-sulfur subunit [Chloroflexota bacterium]|jgi:Rieske Fe-S protein|nr:cytochrome b6-f complex iron-sulfur subunit [Chloroflexota bacterium]
MDQLARAILRLYPAAWRDRYRDELEDLLGVRRVRASDLADLLRGALDARVHPQVRPLLQVAIPSSGAIPMSTMAHRPAYGVVESISASVISRRSFMRRMLGAGVGLLSLEFLGGTLAFLWPGPAEGMGVEYSMGTLDEINAAFPDWARGTPIEFRPARAFVVNVPAAKAMAMGEATSVIDPAAGEVLALWRKCPHLGCMIPQACETRSRFQCYCHQSTYNIIGEKLELGPAPRGMDRFPVRIDADGVVIVDTRELITGPPKGSVSFHDPHPPGVGCA